MMIWPPRGRDPTVCPSRRIARWNTLIPVCLALALLMMTACGQPAHATSHATATVKPTATNTHALALTWRAATAPPGTASAIAPGDGDIAYACQAESARRISVSVTRDRAVHWTHAGDIALAADANHCFITVDSLQPTTVVVDTIWDKGGSSPPISYYTSYVTFDGGATWRNLSAEKVYLASQFATLDGVIYGYLRVSDGEQDSPELAISRDQMRTWRPILRNISDTSAFGPTYFWLNPVNGALLVRDASVFWSSGDAGAHWAKVAAPGLATPGSEVVVQTPVANQPWRLCVAGDDEMNPEDMRPNTLACSFDGGKTWRNEPAINTTFTSAKGNFATPTDVFALASDGAVLAAASNGSDPAVNSDYRLIPGAQTWQPLGQPPGTNTTLSYYPAPGGGVLWDGTLEGSFTASYP